MKPLVAWLRLSLFLCAIGGSPVAAEAPAPYLPQNILRAHRVALTQRAVVAALKNKNIEVRRAAAALLVKRWPKAAPSALEQAIPGEPDGFTRNYMARDLLRTGDPFGRKTLISQCHNAANWGSVRMDAATELTRDFGDDSCIDSVLQVLHSPTDPRDDGGKAQALDLVPILMGRVSQAVSQELFRLLISSLRDPNSYVQATASNALGRLGNVHTIPGFQSVTASNSLGRKALTSLCHDATAPGSVRMDAAKHLSQNFGDDSCLDSVFQVLQSPTDPKDFGAKSQAMENARTMIGQVDQTQSQKLFDLITASLRDPECSVRIDAAVQLEHLGDVRAIPKLKAALASEADKSCRRMVSASLEVLQNRTGTR